MLHWSVVVWMWCLHSQGVLKGWVTTDSSSLIKLKSYFIFLFLIFIILVLSWDQNKFQIFEEMCICLWARSLHDLLIQESFVSLLIMLFTKCWWLERNRKGTGYMKCVLMKQIFSSLKSVKWKKNYHKVVCLHNLLCIFFRHSLVFTCTEPKTRSSEKWMLPKCKW